METEKTVSEIDELRRREAGILTRKPNYFDACLLFFDNGRCMFCPGSGTKQATSSDVRRSAKMGDQKTSNLHCAAVPARCLFVLAA
jgi:hypothetical protein